MEASNFTVLFLARIGGGKANPILSTLPDEN